MKVQTHQKVTKIAKKIRMEAEQIGKVLRNLAQLKNNRHRMLMIKVSKITLEITISRHRREKKIMKTVNKILEVDLQIRRIGLI